MSGPCCCLLELQLIQGRGSLLSCEYGFGLFHKFRMESDENRKTHKRFHLWWQIPMNSKSVKTERKCVLWLASMASVASSGDLATLIPLSPPRSSYRHHPDTSGRTPRGERAPTSWLLQIGTSFTQKWQPWLESTLCCSHPCWRFLRQMRGRERRERQTKCSAVWGRHNVELCRTQFFMVLEF